MQRVIHLLTNPWANLFKFVHTILHLSHFVNIDVIVVQVGCVWYVGKKFLEVRHAGND
jgi:hypothetical protein